MNSSEAAWQSMIWEGVLDEAASYSHVVDEVHCLTESLAMRSLPENESGVFEGVVTIESGLNSMVLASNNEMVLLPMNEPMYGTKRKSQIETYLEHNEDLGL
ncbi:hypothetical protein SUGI_0962490 [Cryptomeria japonica]|nr:hypothetical protein SUGI_0962490 [Cryptomeria japonica]